MDRYCQLCNAGLGAYCAPCTAMLGKSEAAPLPPRRCTYCRAVLPPATSGGRPQQYCTRACRDAAYYRRRHMRKSAEDPLHWFVQCEEWQERYAALHNELRQAQAEIARLTALVTVQATD
jgi:hypothetical protein